MGDIKRLGNGQNPEVGGYNPGDKVGWGEVVGPEKACDKGIKPVFVDLNLNRRIDDQDKVIYVKKPTGIEAVLGFIATLGNPVPDLVTPKDPVTRKIQEAEKKLDTNLFDRKVTNQELHQATEAVAEAKKGEAASPVIAARRDELEDELRDFYSLRISDLLRKADIAVKEGRFRKNLLHIGPATAIGLLRAAEAEWREASKLDSNYRLPQDVHAAFGRILQAAIDKLENRARLDVKLTQQEADFVLWARQVIQDLGAAGPAED